jgi:hypothetical protein
MHTGISSARACDLRVPSPHLFSPEEAQHAFQFTLDGTQTLLLRPARKIAAIVSDVKANTNQPASETIGDGLFG